MLLKRELARKSAELCCLDAHIALLNKCNIRLEKENVEQKRFIKTLRLDNDDTLGKGTQSISVEQESHPRHYKISLLSTMFPIQRVYN